MKPTTPEVKTYLIYELIEKSRISGIIEDLHDFIELCVETFGEKLVIKLHGYK